MGAAAPDLSDYRISAHLWSSDDVATRTLLLYCAADLSGPTGNIYVYVKLCNVVNYNVVNGTYIIHPVTTDKRLSALVI